MKRGREKKEGKEERERKEKNERYSRSGGCGLSHFEGDFLKI